MNSVSETNYKTSSSDLCMLMGSSQNQQHEPKLENFLGRHSFADHDHHHTYNTNGTAEYMFPGSCGSLNVPSEAANNGGASVGTGNNVNGSSIGLSMIKTWLRNQPPPTQPTEAKNDGAAAGATAASSTHQTLSLSMSTGSQSSSALPLLTAGGASGGESSSLSDSSNKQQPRTTTAMTTATATATGLDSQTTATEAVPRKSIDTFGQRTSIYRGVTRSIYFVIIL